jgi:hypothetical protein
MPGTPGARPYSAAQMKQMGAKTKSETLGDGSGLDKNKQEKKEEVANQSVKGVSPRNPTSAASSLRYPYDAKIDRETDYVRFDFWRYTPPFGQKARAGGEGTTLDFYNFNATAEKNYEKDGNLQNIILYMPEDVSTGYKTNWSGKNISNIGASMLKVAGAGSIGDAAGKFVEGAADAIDKAVPIVQAQVINAAIGKVTGESLSLDDIFGSTRGAILNPNTELLFSGFDLRNFSLNYKLVPRNPTEANNIEGIIKTFKQAMLPSANSGVGPDFQFNIGGQPYNAGFIRVPSVVQVSFMRGNGLNKNVPQYKMCALTQVDVNYTPDGVYATTEDGKMVAYQLTLNFQETKLIFREDVEAGF